MNRRQAQWHDLTLATGEFPVRLEADAAAAAATADGHVMGMSLQEIHALEDGGHTKGRGGGDDGQDKSGHFCLTLVERAKAAVNLLDYTPPIALGVT